MTLADFIYSSRICPDRRHCTHADTAHHAL